MTDLANQCDNLKSALEKMMALHSAMMSEINHGASFYSSSTLVMMNEAPAAAEIALRAASKNLEEVHHD